MIGLANRRRLDLLRCRAGVLKDMEMVATLARSHSGEFGEVYKECLKELGQISQRYIEIIAYEDRHGIPEKWTRYHEFEANFEKVIDTSPFIA